tara:strand:- start:140 stop:277 length:138 start_codon:yes stop_codon:yes gene_type:complete
MWAIHPMKVVVVVHRMKVVVVHPMKVVVVHPMKVVYDGRAALRAA